MTYTEDIHKKIMKIHDPKGNRSGFLMTAGALTLLIYIVLLLIVWGTPKALPVAILGALAIGTGSNYRNIHLLLFRKGIIIRKFDPEIRKYILGRGETSSYKRTRLKRNLDEFIEECKELAPEYRNEALYLRMKKWIELEVPEIIEEDTKFEKGKFEEYKERHGFLKLDLEKEKN